ncbi:hypothetical protein Avbf_16952, partial [Armadillidium vulgare]
MKKKKFRLQNITLVSKYVNILNPLKVFFNDYLPNERSSLCLNLEYLKILKTTIFFIFRDIGKDRSGLFPFFLFCNILCFEFYNLMFLFFLFGETWSTINRKKYRCGKVVVIEDVRGSILKFLEEQLSRKQQRDDYREILELALIFLANFPRRGISFHIPEALRQARIKICIKIVVLRYNIDIDIDMDWDMDMDMDMDMYIYAIGYVDIGIWI